MRVSVVGSSGSGKSTVARRLADNLGAVYRARRDSLAAALVWEPAELVVWVNPPRWRVMVQVILRTLRRAATREELWNGNREGWGGLRIWDPSDSVIRWAWDSYGPQVKRYEAAMADPRHSHLRFVRLRTRRDVERFLEHSTGVQDLDVEC